MHHQIYQMCHIMRKPVFGASDQVRHKPGCTAEGGWRLEILNLGRRGIVLSGANNGPDQLHIYRAVDLRLR